MASAMRSMWKGVVQFGLVTVPVKLYLATDPHSTGAHLLHASCLSRIRQRTWCPGCDCEVRRIDIVRGYEVAPGRWITVRDDELASLPVRTLHTIDVAQFVPMEDAARLETWTRQHYYLEPEPLGRRAFALLCATLEETELAAVAKIAIRDREHIATVRPLDDGLMLTTLAWPEEVRSINELDLPPHADVPEAELRLARDLVRAMARPFDAVGYRDEYADSLRRLLESKSAGAAFALDGGPRSAALTDLMAALQASVAAAAGKPEVLPATTRSRKRPRAGSRRMKVPASAA